VVTGQCHVCIVLARKPFWTGFDPFGDRAAYQSWIHSGVDYVGFDHICGQIPSSGPEI